MNNDISSELTGYIKPKRHASKNFAQTDKTVNNGEMSEKSYETAQQCYNALGHAKVNMDKNVSNSVLNSVEMLKKDPGYVQSHVDFCDSLQSMGYSLEDAIIKTDMIFEKLKDASIYHP